MNNKRGRPGAAALSVVSMPGQIERVQRPRPPADLTEEQVEEWWAIVNRMPADWFPAETHPLLIQLCRHTVSSRKIAQLQQACERRRTIDLDKYEKLLKMQGRETQAIAALSSKLRISPQAQVKHDRARKPTVAPRPWDVQEEDEDEG